MKTITLSIAFVFSTIAGYCQYFHFAKIFFGSGGYNSTTIGLDSQRNIYTTGSFSGTVDFDPDFVGVQNQSSTNYSPDVYISKLDSLGNYVWSKKFGGSGGDWVMDMFVEKSGAFLLTGSVSLNADLDPGPATMITGDTSFISKFDYNGDFVWAKTLNAIPVKIKVDLNNDIYMLGSFSNTVDFDPGSGTFNLTAQSSYSDMFILKLNAAGNFVWAKKFNSIFSHYVRDIDVDQNGNLYLSGAFEGQLDADPGTGTLNLYSQGSEDVFIVKLDSSGDIVWAKSMGGIDMETCEGIGVDLSGNVYLAGLFKDVVDFDPGTGVHNVTATGQDADIYYWKLDSNGDFIWAKKIGSIDFESISCLKVGKSGNLYCAGRFQSVVDFDPDPAVYNFMTPNLGMGFTLKIDSAGSLIWAKQSDAASYKLSIDTFENVYATGLADGSVNWDPGASNYSNTGLPYGSFFIMKYSSTPVSILPLKLLSFDASAVNNGIHLNWVTASEVNTDKFEIQKSKNGIDWEFIGGSKASGNSIKKHSYNYLDEKPYGGDSYYRIKQIDLDGSSTYSKIVKVFWNIESSTLNPYPNPTERFVNFEVNGNTSVAIYNSLGLDVISNISINTLANKLTLDLFKLPAGTYILVVGTQKSIIVKK